MFGSEHGSGKVKFKEMRLSHAGDAKSRDRLGSRAYSSLKIQGDFHFPNLHQLWVTLGADAPAAKTVNYDGSEDKTALSPLQAQIDVLLVHLSMLS